MKANPAETCLFKAFVEMSLLDIVNVLGVTFPIAEYPFWDLTATL